MAAALVACPGPTPPPEGLATGLAVVCSDYDSTSISLLDPATNTIVRDGCLHSGTRAPGLSLALSGDVAVATRPNGQGELVVIDRAYAAVTWLDPLTCTPLRQLAIGTGYPANPHDVVTVSATKAYVTRYDRNASPTADPGDFDDGDDLLVIDPSVPRITGRVDLSAYADTVDGVKLVARPERAVLARGKVYVVLGHQSVDFQKSGPAKVAVVDPARDVVERVIDLPEPMRVCGGIDFDEASGRLAIVCGGAFSAGEAQPAQSGVVFVDLDSDSELVQAIASTSVATRPLNFEFVAFTAGGYAAAGTVGTLDGTPDLLVSFDAAPTSRTVLDAGEPFVVGISATDAAKSRLFVPVASASNPRVVSYALAADGTTSAPVERTASASGLPPRQIARF